MTHATQASRSSRRRRSIVRDTGSAIVLLLAATSAPNALATDAHRVLVRDVFGAPIAGAEIVCRDPGSGGVSTTGEDGIAYLVGECREVECRTAEHVAAVAENAQIEDAEVQDAEVQDAGVLACTLERGMIVTGTVRGRCEACVARLIFHPLDRDDPENDEGEVFLPETIAEVPLVAPGDAAASFRFRPVTAPGRASVEIVAPDGWGCRQDVPAPTPGHHGLVVEWRPPGAVTGVVRDPDGNGIEHVPVHARSAPPTPRWGNHAAAARIAPSCGPTTDSPVLTDAAGTFTVAVDGAHRVELVAGGWEHDAGIAYLDGLRSGARDVVLRPRRPVTAVGLVASGGQPRGCEAFLETPDDFTMKAVRVLVDDSRKALRGGTGGATLDAVCLPDGTFELGPMLPGPFSVEILPDGAVPVRVQHDGGDPGTVVDLGTVEVDTGESIRVVVLAGGETPIEGASVRADGVETLYVRVEGETDEDGTVTLTGLPRQAMVDLRVEAEGYVRVDVGGLGLDEFPYEVSLEEGGTIEGRVVGASREPIPGAQVTAVPAEGGRLGPVTTDDDGAFALDGLPTGSVDVFARARGYRDGHREGVPVRASSVRSGVRIELEPGDGLRGRVVDAEGAPVADADVRLVPRWVGSDGAVARTRSGSDGSFEIAREPTEGQELLAHKRGFGSARETSLLQRGAEEVELRLTPPASVLSRVVGSPRPGEEVEVSDGHGFVHRAPVAKAGTARIDDLAPGKGSARLVGGHAREVVLVAGEVSEVELGRGVGLEGVVTSRGTPLEGAVVQATGVSEDGVSGGGVTAITSIDGRYRLDGLESRRTLVVAQAFEGRVEEWVDLPSEGSATLDLVIDPVIVLASVTDTEGAPIAGASISLQGLQPEGGSGISSGATRSNRGIGYSLTVSNCACVTGRTGGSGVARIQAARSGTTTVRVEHEGYERWEDSIELVTGDNPLEISMTARAQRRLIVDVTTDPPGLEGQFLCGTMQSSSMRSGIRARRGLECGQDYEGAVWAYFTVPGYGSARGEAVMAPEGDTRIELVVERGGRLVIPIPELRSPVAVIDRAGQDWTGRGGSHITNRTETAGGGFVLAIEGIPPGTYAVTVAGEARSEVVVRPGETVTAW